MKKLLITFAILFLGWLIYLGIGETVNNPDVIIKETADSIYVKQYSIYNKDSVVRAFRQHKIYEGVVTDKHKHTRFVGIPGKGGHMQTTYRTTIKYNGETYDYRNGDYYNKYNEGDTVTVKEFWYPYHDVEILDK
jgi:hypothetical protein